MKNQANAHRGDEGWTDLCGKRVEKTDLRIALLGAIDRCSADLCVWRCHVRESAQFPEILNALDEVSRLLCALSSHIAGYEPFNSLWLDFLDKSLEAFQVPETKGFVDFSRYGLLSCSGNLARCSCRAAELESLRLGEETRHISVLLNRLSSCFFLWARACKI